MLDWQRKRHPDDVPTPLAVALSDFCRRARAPASAAAVRDALSFLDEDEDAPLRQLTDAEPTATPLGPFAVVDIVTGADTTVATEREKSGYYVGIRKLARSAPPPQAPVPVLAGSAPGARASAPSSAAPARKKRKTRASVAERIAPQRRAKGEEKAARPKAVPSVPASSFLPRHNLPAPRGRFAVIDPSRVALDSLARPQAHDLLAELVAQSPTRFDLLKRLGKGYTGRRGAPVSMPDVESLLLRTELWSDLYERERSVVLGAVGDQRGALGRSAAGLGLTVDQLIDLIDALHLRPQIEDIRAGFIREALDPANLLARLDLLRRRKYLEDLDIVERFEAALGRDVVAALDDPGSPWDGGDLVERVARARGLPEDLLRRAVERLNLSPSSPVE